MLTKDLITKNVDLNKKIFIALSGGPDSTALLHLLSTINKTKKLELKAIHINHNLSKNCFTWEKHCEDMCSKLAINLQTESVKIKSEGGGIESASRKARNKIFENILQDGDQILLAHHSDDVAETVFMRMLRGTGAEGMEGPQIKRMIGKGILIRPLLSASKQEILNYLNANNIKYIEDESNHSNEFDRNYIRNKIFPMLEERWKNFPKRINNAAQIFRNRNNIYSELMYEKYRHIIGKKIRLNEIKELPDSIIADILRYSIKECNISSPNSKIIEEIIKTFVHSNPGSKSIVSWSRSDKEEVAGKIEYQEGYIVISKR